MVFDRHRNKLEGTYLTQQFSKRALKKWQSRFHFLYLIIAQMMLFDVGERMWTTFFVEFVHAWPFRAVLCSHRRQLQVAYKYALTVTMRCKR